MAGVMGRWRLGTKIFNILLFLKVLKRAAPLNDLQDVNSLAILMLILRLFSKLTKFDKLRKFLSAELLLLHF